MNEQGKEFVGNQVNVARAQTIDPSFALLALIGSFKSLEFTSWRPDNSDELQMSCCAVKHAGETMELGRMDPPNLVSLLLAFAAEGGRR